MEVKIKHNEEFLDATIEMVDGVMVVTPMESKVDYSQYKDGDIIVCGWEESDRYAEWVCILNGRIDKCVELYIEDYCGLDLKNSEGKCNVATTSGFSDSATYVRYATEEEKQKLFDALAKEGKMWDEKKKAVVNLRDKPSKGDFFYIIDYYHTRFNYHVVEWHDSEYENLAFEKGLAYTRTSDNATKCCMICDKLNEAIKDIKP